MQKKPWTTITGQRKSGVINEQKQRYTYIIYIVVFKIAAAIMWYNN
jgi:hypothetical protein